MLNEILADFYIFSLEITDNQQVQTELEETEVEEDMVIQDSLELQGVLVSNL